MAQEAGVSGRGNAQIKKPTAPKQAPYVQMGNTEGVRYGMAPHRGQKGKGK